MKEVIIVAGANGSGKTTFAKDFVKEKAYYFVNADEIGAALEGQAGFQLKAGRIFGSAKLRVLVREQNLALIFLKANFREVTAPYFYHYRIFFEKIKELVEARQSFVMESTLSGGYLTRIVEQLRKYEYAIRIVYAFL